MTAVAVTDSKQSRDSVLNYICSVCSGYIDSMLADFYHSIKAALHCIVLYCIICNCTSLFRGRSNLIAEGIKSRDCFLLVTVVTCM